MTRRRSPYVIGAVLVGLVLAGTALAATSQAQSRVVGDVLLNESALVGFENAEDTVIEENRDRPDSVRASQAGIQLRGPDTFTAPGSNAGERDYLLGLSASGGLGVSDDVRQRYENGRVEDAFLELSYTDGCNSPNGRLTVRAITNPSWSPVDVSWEDTTRANGTLEVDGAILAQTPISPDTVQNNPRVTCQGARLPLEIEPVREILDTRQGGLALFWEGEQPINVSTLDAAEDSPRLDINFTTNGPTVHNVSVEDSFPQIVDTGERFSVFVNATDPQGLPENGVEVGIEQLDGSGSTTVDASRQTGLFVATHVFARDAEGLYGLHAEASDTDDWMDTGVPNVSSPHIVADGTEPVVTNATLAGLDAPSNVTRDQGTSAALAANVSDLSCQIDRSPCGSWQLAWRDQTLARGNLTPGGAIDAEVPLDRPGNTTAQLTVTDPVGHTNDTHRWNLTVVDTQPPSARALQGSDLAARQSTTVENGTPIDVRFEVLDDLPVETAITLEGTEAIERDLPSPDAEGRVETTLTDVPTGSYEAVLVLSDTEHTVQVDFGQLRVAPQGSPTVLVDLPGARVGAEASIPVEIRDPSLDDNATRVSATVNGLSVTPDVDRTVREDGLDLTVRVSDLSHDDEFELRVYAEDDQGLSSNASARATVDAKPPELIEPDETAWFAPGAQVRFETEDPGGGSVDLTIETTSAQVQGSAPRSVSVDRLVDRPGALTEVTVGLRDDVGNERTVPLQLGVDGEDPTVNATFEREGLVLLVGDAASGIRTVSAAVAVNDEPINATQTFQLGPNRYFVKTGEITRGDEIRLAAQVRDEVGNDARLGTRANPVELTVPDRPTRLAVERRSPAVGDTGQIAWNATDPDATPIQVSLTVQSPSGSQERSGLPTAGTHTIQPDGVGRYEVTVTASTGENETSQSVFFLLAPDGRVTQVTSSASEVTPGQPLTYELSFPDQPDAVFVTATDETNATTSANVTIEGTTAQARFGGLPAGSYTVQATVVHDEGAVEEVEVASVEVAEPLSATLGDLVVPLLILLAVALVVAIVAVWYHRREEEDEDAEAETGGPA